MHVRPMQSTEAAALGGQQRSSRIGHLQVGNGCARGLLVQNGYVDHQGHVLLPHIHTHTQVSGSRTRHETVSMAEVHPRRNRARRCIQGEIELSDIERGHIPSLCHLASTLPTALAAADLGLHACKNHFTRQRAHTWFSTRPGIASGSVMDSSISRELPFLNTTWRSLTSTCTCARAPVFENLHAIVVPAS